MCLDEVKLKVFKQIYQSESSKIPFEASIITFNNGKNGIVYTDQGHHFGYIPFDSENRAYLERYQHIRF